MRLPTTLTITDDSGFLAIVNPDRYHSFVDSEWELTELFSRFVDEMNQGNLIIWATGYENDWNVIFLNRPSNETSFREFSTTIEVTNGKLFLTNYEDLTMAAQVQDEKLPSRHNADLCLNLDNGKYEFTIRQLFDPEDYNYVAHQKINFEIIIRPDSERQPKIDRVFWWTE